MPRKSAKARFWNVVSTIPEGKRSSGLWGVLVLLEKALERVKSGPSTLRKALERDLRSARTVAKVLELVRSGAGTIAKAAAGFRCHVCLWAKDLA